MQTTTTTTTTREAARGPLQTEAASRPPFLPRRPLPPVLVPRLPLRVRAAGVEATVSSTDTSASLQKGFRPRHWPDITCPVGCRATTPETILTRGLADYTRCPVRSLALTATKDHRVSRITSITGEPPTPYVPRSPPPTCLSRRRRAIRFPRFQPLLAILLAEKTERNCTRNTPTILAPNRPRAAIRLTVTRHDFTASYENIVPTRPPRRGTCTLELVRDRDSFIHRDIVKPWKSSRITTKPMQLRLAGWTKTFHLSPTKRHRDPSVRLGSFPSLRYIVVEFVRASPRASFRVHFPATSPIYFFLLPYPSGSSRASNCSEILRWYSLRNDFFAGPRVHLFSRLAWLTVHG